MTICRGGIRNTGKWRREGFGYDEYGWMKTMLEMQEYDNDRG